MGNVLGDISLLGVDIWKGIGESGLGEGKGVEKSGVNFTGYQIGVLRMGNASQGRRGGQKRRGRGRGRGRGMKWRRLG